MTELFHGYSLLGDWSSENAGFCRWTFAGKKGKVYFLKEFTDPVFPVDKRLSPVILKDRRAICREFEREKAHLYEEVNAVSDGNLMRIEEFFRYGSRYYVAMPRVADGGLSVAEIAKKPEESRLLLCRTIAHSMMLLHERGIVHADIKPGNVLVKTTKKDRMTAKIIDYDSGFFEMNPPRDGDDLHGDQVYLSPEALRFFVGEHVLLTCAMDVFALGILFHEYLTGEIPAFNRKEYDYPCEALLEGDRLILSPRLNSMGGVKEMIEGMLLPDPARRIPVRRVFEFLSGRAGPSGAGGFRPALMSDLE